MNARDRDLAEREAARFLRALLEAPACAEVTAVGTTGPDGHLRGVDIEIRHKVPSRLQTTESL